MRISHSWIDFEWESFIHISLWSDLGPWWNVRYNPSKIDSPYEPQIISISFHFWLDIVVTGALGPGLSMISYLNYSL